MKTKWIHKILLLLLVFSFVPEKAHSRALTAPRSGGLPYVPDEVLVGLAEGRLTGPNILQYDRLPAEWGHLGILSATPLISSQSFSTIQAHTARRGNVYRLHLASEVDVLSVVAALNADPAVAYAEPNYIIRTTTVPDDPYYFQQWGLTQIGAEGAWEIIHGVVTMTLAVLDTGLDLDHPDLEERLWVNPGEVPGDGEDNDGNGYVNDINGWNWVEDNNIPQDDSGHGTHVTGIAAATGNNGIGVAGVDWNVRIMPLRILNAGGAGTHADAAAALIYAADKGAQVINMSFGAYADSQTLRDAVEYASETALLVGAAGNSDRTDPFYPAAYSQVLAVGATGPDDRKAAFSNYGDWVDLVAPGQSIWSTVYDDTYVGWSGTSMAAPFVAGAATLVWAHYSTLSPGSLRQQLLNTAVDIDDLNPTYGGQLGSGRLNLYAALNVPPRPQLVLQEHAVEGIRDGRPEPEATVGITVTLFNTWADAMDVVGVLSTTSPYVAVNSETTTFDDIPGNQSRANTDPFIVTLEPTTPFNSPITFTLQVTSTGNYSVSLPFTITTASSLQTIDSLTVDTDTIWTADRQYVIGGQVQVQEGVTLTIEPGVLIQFQLGGSLVVSGTLIAEGMASAPVVFEGEGDDLWGGITFTPLSVGASLDTSGDYMGGSILRHVQVLSATTGVALEGIAPLIIHSIFSGNGVGLAVAGSSPLLEGNTFIANNTGVALSNGGQAHLEDNFFAENEIGLSGDDVALTVRRNHFVGNDTGLTLDTSGSTLVEGNLVEKNTIGAALAPGWPSGNRTHPDVAYVASQDGYLVVWQDGRNTDSERIYAQNLSGEGALVSSEIAVATSGENYAPRLACDSVGDACLIVYQSRIPISDTYQLLGQMLTGGGHLSGSVFAIGLYTGTQSTFTVAANTTEGGYLVAWNDAMDGDYDVFAQRVTAAGMLTGTKATVIADSLDQLDVALAYNTVTNEYLVVWAEDQGLFSGLDLYGRRVQANGSFAGIPFTVSAASGNQRHPALAAEGMLGWYTVVWEDSRNSRCDIYGRRVTGTSVLYGNDVAIETTRVYQYTDVNPLPHVTYHASSGEMLTVWLGETTETIGRRLSASGALVPVGDRLCVGCTPFGRAWPRVTINPAQDEYLSIWSYQGDSMPAWLPFAQRLDIEGTQLDNPTTARDESFDFINFPVVLGASFTQNTVVGNDIGLSVSAVEPDLLGAQHNNLVHNTTYNAVNTDSEALSLINNYWGYTDTTSTMLN